MEVKRVRDTTTPEPVVPSRKTFPPRDMREEMSFFYEFLAKGIDAEDISYFHKSYEALLSQDALQVVKNKFGSLLSGLYISFFVD